MEENFPDDGSPQLPGQLQYGEELPKTPGSALVVYGSVHALFLLTTRVETLGQKLI